MKALIGALISIGLICGSAALAAPEGKQDLRFHPSECVYSKEAETLYCEREIEPVVYAVVTTSTAPDPTCTAEGQTGQRAFQHEHTYVETWVTYAIYASHSAKTKFELVANEAPRDLELVETVTTDLGCEPTSTPP